MKSAIEKTHEIILGDDGIQVTIRPMLPFASEEFRMRNGNLQLIGDGRSLSLAVPPELVQALSEADQLHLLEFPVRGAEPEREIIVSASGSALAI